MKKNGFTLTELIAVIAIIGIVVLITIPVIKNMSKKNMEEKYTSYVVIVENALKTYGDLELQNNAVARLTLDDLVNSDYITRFTDATVRIVGASSFAVSKEDNGKITITPEVKLNFTKNSTTKTCTKTFCS